LATDLSAPLNAVTLNSDVIRKELAGVSASEHQYASFEQGIYTPEFSRRTYDELLKRARSELLDGRSVILDATFKQKEDRIRALAIAEELGLDGWIIECVLDERVMTERMRQREAEPSASDARGDDLPRYQESFEPINEIASYQHIRVDTGEEPKTAAQRTIDELPYFFK
jgi:predicted kinase